MGTRGSDRRPVQKELAGTTKRGEQTTHHGMSIQKHGYARTRLPPLRNGPLQILHLLTPARPCVLPPSAVLRLLHRLAEAALVEREDGEACAGERGVDVGEAADVVVEAVDSYYEGFCAGAGVEAGVEEGVLGARNICFSVGCRRGGHRG